MEGLWVVLGVVVGGLLTIFLLRQSHKSVMDERNSLLVQLRAGEAQLQSQAVLVARLQVESDNHAKAEQEWRTKFNEAEGMLQLALPFRPLAEERSARLKEMQEELLQKEKLIQNTQSDLSLARASLAAAETRLAEQESLMRLQKDQESEQRVHWQTKVEQLTQSALEQRGKQLVEMNKNQLDTLLIPLKEQIDGFRKRVDETHVESKGDRAGLREAIDSLKAANQRINAEAENLTRALRGDKKLQGTWGEVQLEVLLQQAGLQAGKTYLREENIKGEDQKNYRPDFIVPLPEGKHLIIDSKVSLSAWYAFHSAEDDAGRTIALREHLQAIEQHIKLLSEKAYQQLPGLKSPEFVLMFLPIEPAFLVATQESPDLFSRAYEKKIALVCPSTLMAMMRTVETVWRHERQTEAARAIADKAGRLYDKFFGFIGDLKHIGARIRQTNEAYEDATKKLWGSPGNLVKQADDLRKLGARTSKELPRDILDQAEASELLGAELRNDDESDKSVQS